MDQFHHIDQRPFNQSISIPNLELVEPRARPMIVRQETGYQQGTRLMRLVFSHNEKSQGPHHRPISRGNQGARIVTYSYCQ